MCARRFEYVEHNDVFDGQWFAAGLDCPIRIWAKNSATLPVTIAALEDKVKVDPKVVRFCIPIGATINMDGTALYEAVAAIFIAQVRRVPLDVGKVIAIRNCPPLLQFLYPRYADRHTWLCLV
ncbi:excitatory amino acid transporter 3-like [Tropilaelaps mercedesae]|uniref:Amino acid transporter n=1 Tax=Tropilaelaps mercedesae TaxID=418985 RepID=A0A1V9XXN2_9ACAR|nr:excitatory amino acid transporter 3-like [Tropilaelaps mercedesae]